MLIADVPLCGAVTVELMPCRFTSRRVRPYTIRSLTVASGSPCCMVDLKQAQNGEEPTPVHPMALFALMYERFSGDEKGQYQGGGGSEKRDDIQRHLVCGRHRLIY